MAGPTENAAGDGLDASPMPNVGPDDIVIAVMGVTGVGKSTFIAHFSKTAKAGDGLESCTSNVSIHPARVGNRDIFLIDTPGFDDTYRSDTDVLREVADWLNQSFQANIQLAGIVYLHRIQDNRVGGSSMKNLRMFKQLCGENGLSCVVLATTMWSMVPRDQAEQREQELINKPEFWGRLISKGSQVLRQDNGVESATKIIEYILSKQKRITLKIQEEMASGKALGETSAGQEVEADIERLTKKHKEEMTWLKQEMQEAIRKKDYESQQEIKAIRAELAAKMNKAQEDRQRLEVNIEELRQQRISEVQKEREQAYQRDLEHQRVMMESKANLATLQAKKELEAQLLEARLKQQYADAEIQRLRDEKDPGPCIVM
ncbi:P-loop containing nucleoside triphosphate hydrolase protein [Lasiosphaeris hirsuta]|uniref:P-loop containing nucleoside triphosphate hydrolase protein n=1 Tax=Lasiosphaeris hirsuta TaxID=260670 RepID=A0AA40A2J1_9PEZI|nr:P-loop containing nucleoside triphosphate hydrolase protein [Lasiosphaeris hirsuta]